MALADSGAGDRGIAASDLSQHTPRGDADEPRPVPRVGRFNPDALFTIGSVRLPHIARRSKASVRAGDTISSEVEWRTRKMHWNRAMRKLVVAACLLLSAAVVAPARATADINQMSPASEHQPEPDPDEQQVADRRRLGSFDAASVSLTDAMSSAERLHDGSRTVQISFVDSGAGEYRVRTLKDNQLWDNIIDANTGKQVGKERLLLLDRLSDDDRSNIAAFKFVRQQLSDAVAVAEKATSGKALGGGLMKDQGKLNFVVIVASENRLKQVMLQPPKAVQPGKQLHRSP